MDDSSKTDTFARAVVEDLAKSVAYRVIFVFILVAVMTTLALEEYIADLLSIFLVWICAEIIFMFLPQYKRHKHLWINNEEYRDTLTAMRNERKPLKILYSDMSDKFKVE